GGAEGRDLRFGLVPTGAAQRWRHQSVGQRVIFRVLWQLLREIDEVAVEIDVLLGDAAYPGEAVRVDGVDEERGVARRERGGMPLLEPIELNARAAEPLDAM